MHLILLVYLDMNLDTVFSFWILGYSIKVLKYPLKSSKYLVRILKKKNNIRVISEKENIQENSFK